MSLLIDLTPAKTVTADFLLTWLATPGTAFYLGDTDTPEIVGIFPGLPDFVNAIGPPSSPTGWQLLSSSLSDPPLTCSRTNSDNS